MFVPKAGGRNTRRRQRTSSDDSVKPPKAKRQRSVLRRPDESPSDTNLGRELAKRATPTPSNADNAPTDQINTESHLLARAAKQGDGIGNNNEGTIVLVGHYFKSLRDLLKSQSQNANFLDSIVKYRFLHSRTTPGSARSNPRSTVRYYTLVLFFALSCDSLTL